MNTGSNVKQLVASTAFAAVLSASAGTAGLCLAAPAPAGIGLRTLRDDPFRAVAGGLRAPAAYPVARTIALGGHGWNG